MHGKAKKNEMKKMKITFLEIFVKRSLFTWKAPNILTVLSDFKKMFRYFGKNDNFKT